MRKTPLQCGRQGEMDRFVNISRTKIPRHSKAVAAESAEGCKSACLTNCSCTAYTYCGGLCSIWVGDLNNIRQASSDKSQEVYIYLRLAASELLGQHSSEKMTTGVIIGIVGGLIIFSVFAFVLTKRFCEFMDSLMGWCHSDTEN